MTIKTQIDAIDPSAKDALFRRLLLEEPLGYLRDGNTIVGFEVMLEQPRELCGYAIIAIQKHTILAYRSDLDETKRLVLFPEMAKLEDPEFELLDLIVQRKIFTEDTFNSPVLVEGPFRDVAQDLIPPYKKVEVSDEMASSMNKAMMETNFKGRNKEAIIKNEDAPFVSNNNGVTSSVDMDAPMDVPMDIPMDVPMDVPMDIPMDVPMDVPYDFEEFNDYPDYDDVPQVQNTDVVGTSKSSGNIEPKSQRAKDFHSQVFNSLSDVSDYAIIKQGIPPDVVANIVNAILRVTDNKKDQIDGATLLCIKLIDDNKV